MSKRRMGGWTPLAVENTDAPQQSPPTPPTPQPQAAPPAEPQPQPEPAAEQPAAPEAAPAPVAAAVADGPVQDPHVPRRRMAGWQPLTVANTAAPAAASPALNGTTSPADTGAPAPSAPATEPAAPAAQSPAPAQAAPRSEERRVGEECRARWGRAGE